MEVDAQQFQIFRLTQEAYDQLWLFARENPKAYLDPDTDFGRVLIDRGVTDYADDTGYCFWSAHKSHASGEGPSESRRPAGSGLPPFHARFDSQRRYRQPDVDLDDPFQVALVRHQALALAGRPDQPHQESLVRGKRVGRPTAKQYRVADLVDCQYGDQGGEGFGRRLHRRGGDKSFRQQSAALPQHDGLELQQTSCRMR